MSTTRAAVEDASKGTPLFSASAAPRRPTGRTQPRMGVEEEESEPQRLPRQTRAEPSYHQRRHTVVVASTTSGVDSTAFVCRTPRSPVARRSSRPAPKRGGPVSTRLPVAGGRGSSRQATLSPARNLAHTIRTCVATVGVASAVFAAVALRANAGSGSVSRASCGVERWTVKTVQDRPRLLPPRATTIHFLVTRPTPRFGLTRARLLPAGHLKPRRSSR